MTQTLTAGTIDEGVFYPESDGKPMAEGSEQGYWVRLIEGGLEDMFADDPNVFVEGDLLWYPVKGKPGVTAAPDAMVVFGRPKGKRKSYIQYLEQNIAPHVCFEIRSFSNSVKEMTAKQKFYDQHGVEEYYMYDPKNGALEGWLRNKADGKFKLIAQMKGWVSPRLKVRFELTDKELQLFDANGESFLSYVEARRLQRQTQERADTARLQADLEYERAEQEYRRAEQAQRRVEQEHKRAEQAQRQAEQEHELAEQAQRQAEQERIAKEKAWDKLREMGFDPDNLR